MRGTIVSIGVLACAWAHGELMAGTAARDITPDVERYRVPMAGYGAREGRPSTGVHDPLFAKILYLKDGDTVLALVTTDLRSTTPELKRQVIAKSEGLGLSRANLMLAGSHNHSGPSLYPEEFWQLQFGEYDPAIVEIMSSRIADGLREAAGGLSSATVGYAEKELPAFTRNRRWEYDTAAREAAGETPALSARLWVMRVDVAGQPRAVLSNYGTHPTILGADNFELSAEWPGVMQDTIEEAFPGVVALYTNGAEGDQAPNGAQGENDFARMEEFGERLGREAIALARSIETKAVSIGYASVDTALGMPKFSEAAKQGRYAFMEPMALEALPRHAELQQFRIGDAVLAALPGEPIAEVGRSVEVGLLALGAGAAVCVGLANDYVGYILNAKEYGHGGYEVDSRSYYGPGLGELIALESGRSGAALFK